MATASSGVAITLVVARDRVDLRRGASFFDAILSPIAAIACAFGPMKTMPASSSAAPNAAFSDRKP